MLSDFPKKRMWVFAALCVIVVVAGCRTPRPSSAEYKPISVTNAVPSSVSGSQSPETNQVVVPSRPRPSAAAADNMASGILNWDSVFKEYHAKPGELKAPFTFNLTNVSFEQVIIFATETTCDCTVAKLPSKPWVLPPGAEGQIHATLDLHNRIGAVTNYVIVETSKGNRLLTVKADVPKS